MPATPNQSPGTGERLQRVLATSGVASRRKAEELIRAGRVTVDGAVVTELGTRVDPSRAAIRVDGKRIQRQKPRYIVMNKPSGFIATTSDERQRPTVMNLLPAGSKVYPVGRLDRDTEGLLLFTNDGEVANRVMHPRYELPKEYVILSPEKPVEAVMRRVRAGVEIDGKLVVPHEFRVMRETRDGVLLAIVVHEGLNRVIRRMMDIAGIPVTELRRVRIGPLSVSGIPRGAHRDLTPGELASLLEALHINRAGFNQAAPGPDTHPKPARKDARRLQAPTSPPQNRDSNRASRREPTIS